MSTHVEPQQSQTVPPEAIEQEINLIKNRIILACMEIPRCLVVSSDEPFGHGDMCNQLPEEAHLRDRWVHGIFYEFVSAK